MRLSRPLRVVAWSLAGVLTVLGVGGFLVYRHLDGNLEGDAAFDRIVGRRPVETGAAVPEASRPLDVLVLGDDTRVGQTSVSGASDSLSDTTILLHLSADRSRAYAVSIPRDLLVPRPRCRSRSDPTTVLPAVAEDQWNQAYALGGPACTIAQVEAMTGVRVDHFVVVKFDSFENVVDALGGVRVCVPETIDDPRHEIHLDAGTYDAKGDTALTYVRARYGIGDGSDVGRMKRQQAFLASMVDEVSSAGTLANPVRLYRFLDAATQSLVTDEGLASLPALVSLGREVEGIGLDHVRFLTMPIAQAPSDVNRLVAGPGAERLWRTLRHDDALGRRQVAGSTSAAHGRPGRGGPAGADAAARAAAVGLCA